jgi:hypothetical protein
MPANYVLLQRATLTAAASSVTLSSIPQTGYTDLKIVISGRDSSSANTSNAGYSFTIYPNGASTNITQRSFFANGVSVLSYSDTQMYTAIEMNADTAKAYNNVEIYCPNYTSANPKSFLIDSVTEHNAAGAAIRMAAGLWNSTAAITSLQFNAYSTWMEGSSFSLYGIANTTTTPKTSSKADGGDIIKTDGTYWYHAFTSTGSFKPQVNLTCDVLVVAGGGGGAYDGGGAGAGGVLAFASQVLSGNQTVTVGAGGTGGLTLGSPLGTNGVDSQFASLTLVKGGGYGASSEQAPTNFPPAIGGSGGGGARYNTSAQTGAAGTSGQGNAGGNGVFSAPQYGAGGGGGKGGVGGNGSSTAGGTGGAGASTVTNWGSLTDMFSVTGLGVSGTIAGGGGGGTYVNGTQGTGSGGGGNGSTQGTAGTAGAANSGGGGGGGAGDVNKIGRSGGSGIIIIRYPV